MDRAELREVEQLLPCRRRDLESVFGMSDRRAREVIYRARECGLAILMPDRDCDAYRVAQTDEEVWQVYREMRGRAIRSLAAAERMIRRHQPSGQTEI